MWKWHIINHNLLRKIVATTIVTFYVIPKLLFDTISMKNKIKIKKLSEKSIIERI